MNFLELKKTITKSDSNSMSGLSKEQIEPKVPVLNFPKKKNSSPIKDDMAVQTAEGQSR